MKQHDLWRNLFLGSALVLIAGLLPQPSQAGFQWVAPAETAAAPSVEVMPQPTMDAMPSLQPVPLQPRTQAVGRGQDVISPTIIEGAQPLPALAPVPLAAAPVPVTAVAPLSGGSEPLPIPAIEKPVDGFANNIPLAVALRQILPPDYSFSLAPDIDTATSVSWRGGAGWRDVLRSMLTNASLGFSEDGRAIRITRTSSFGAFAAAPPIAAPLPEPVVVSQPVAQVLPAQTVVLEQAPVAEGPIIDTWSAESGQSLRNVLEAWCQKTGIQLVWQAEYDYPLQASYSTTSTFEDAVRNLLLGFQEAQPQPYASLYNNPSVGQAVLVIEARGNNYSD